MLELHKVFQFAPTTATGPLVNWHFARCWHNSAALLPRLVQQLDMHLLFRTPWPDIRTSWSWVVMSLNCSSSKESSFSIIHAQTCHQLFCCTTLNILCVLSWCHYFTARVVFDNCPDVGQFDQHRSLRCGIALFKGYRGGSPTAVQAWQPWLLWEPFPIHPILV